MSRFSLIDLKHVPGADSSTNFADIFQVEFAILASQHITEIRDIVHELVTGGYPLNCHAIPSPALRCLYSGFYDDTVDQAVYGMVLKWMQRDILFAHRFARLVPIDLNDTPLLSASLVAIDTMIESNTESIKDMILRHETQFLLSTMRRDANHVATVMRYGLDQEIMDRNLQVLDDTLESVWNAITRFIQVLKEYGINPFLEATMKHLDLLKKHRKNRTSAGTLAAAKCVSEVVELTEDDAIRLAVHIAHKSSKTNSMDVRNEAVLA